jgi:hypothetical protein
MARQSPCRVRGARGRVNVGAAGEAIGGDRHAPRPAALPSNSLSARRSRSQRGGAGRGSAARRGLRPDELGAPAVLREGQAHA